MNSTKMFLEKHPYVGMAGGIGSAMTSLFNMLEPVLQTIALMLGILVAWATLMAQIERKRLDKLKQVQIRGELKPRPDGSMGLTARTETEEEFNERTSSETS